MHDFAKQVFRLLNDAGVEYVVVGGVSAVLQGVPVVTQDLDLCYRRTPENMRKPASALSPLNPRPRGFPAELPFSFDERTLQLGCNFTFEVEDEHLDLLGEMSAIGGYDAIIGTVVSIDLGELSLKVLSLTQLIATKEAANRPKDHAVLPTLRAFLQIPPETGPNGTIPS